MYCTSLRSSQSDLRHGFEKHDQDLDPDPHQETENLADSQVSGPNGESVHRTLRSQVTVRKVQQSRVKISLRTSGSFGGSCSSQLDHFN